MIQYCKLCLMPSTRPRIVFKDGVCNACTHSQEKQEIDWDARKKEFLEVIDEYRSDGPYDCVVPFSGGKDSAAIAFRLKRDYGLNPLLVTYGQMLWTEVGRRNLEQVCRLGFDIDYHRVDQRVSARLARRFLVERGCPKIHYNAGVNAVPVRTAVERNIPLVFYAEHGESEYGGLVLDKESLRTRNLTEVLEHQIGDDPRNWAIDGITENELTPYIYPGMDDIERVGVKAFYFSYFFKWDIHENYELVRDQMGFEGVERSDGTFVGWDSIDDCIDDLDFFMMHVKFGFGRATRMASRLIQGGHMMREEGLKLVRKYDGEFPKMYLPQILEYLDMDLAKLMAVVEQHRNPELWHKPSIKTDVPGTGIVEVVGEWQLKHPPE